MKGDKVVEVAEICADLLLFFYLLREFKGHFLKGTSLFLYQNAVC